MLPDGTRTTISAEQMKQVLEVSRLLAATDDLDQLLLRIAQAATAMLRCERASIFLYDARRDQLWTKVALESQEIRVPSHAGIVGHVFKNNAILHVPQPYQDARFNSEPDRRTGFVTRNLVTAPMVNLDRQPVGVVQAVNKLGGAFDALDMEMIQLLADQAGVAIQRYNLQQSAVEAVALRREMELAKQVQQKLLPSSMPQVGGIDSIGWTLSASITGGDCFDLWRTSDDKLGIFVGDATGHGIGPAMMVSQARTLVRALCDRDPDPCALLTCANARLAEDLDAGHFVTAFVAFLSRDGSLAWCSAGHGPILIRDRGDGSIAVLAPTAPPLGVLPNFLADRAETRWLGSGGEVAIVSDGIHEAFSPAGEEFDAVRVIEILDQNRTAPLQTVLDRLREAVRAWQGSDEPRDDQTVVLARVR